MSLVDRLRGFAVLESFSMQQLAALAAIGEEQDAASGTVLFREGDEAREMLFLIEGRVSLTAQGGQVDDVPPLSLIGEMGVLQREPRVATATVTEPLRYLAVPAEDFHRLTEEDPELGLKFFRNLSSVLMWQLKRNNLVVQVLRSKS